MQCSISSIKIGNFRFLLLFLNPCLSIHLSSGIYCSIGEGGLPNENFSLGQLEDESILTNNMEYCRGVFWLIRQQLRLWLAKH